MRSQTRLSMLSEVPFANVAHANGMGYCEGGDD